MKDIARKIKIAKAHGVDVLFISSYGISTANILILRELGFKVEMIGKQTIKISWENGHQIKLFTDNGR